MNWTEKQLQTITHRGKNILVSAAAGSGKTAVLTERIRRIVTEDRVPLSEILVVTFTEAAASEMKSRIFAALAEAASRGDPFAEKQLAQMGAAKIMTFHSFALSILKQHFHIIELDPSFQVCDEQRAAFLKQEAMDLLFAERFEANEEAFPDFLKNYANARNENEVRDMISELYRFVRTLPDSFEWLARNVSLLFADGQTFWDSPAMDFARDEIAYVLARIRRSAAELGVMLGRLGFPRMAQKNEADLRQLETLEKVFASGDYDGTRAALEGIGFSRFSPGKQEKENGWEAYSELVKLRRNRVKDEIKSLRETFFARDAAVCAEEIRQAAPYAHIL
ncbi:MAG: UvrD-helicase domain-containing protein, partial [Clostridiales Family XIII bacterium]|nr:UvrD-helicase domain-containing protein [Clostridiales Family XIII bacterium]